MPGTTTNSSSVGLINKTWGFFDAGTASSGESSGVYANSTNAYLQVGPPASPTYIATNKVFHFKIVLDPANKLYDGYVTNVTDSPTVGFSTFDYTGRHFHWRLYFLDHLGFQREHHVLRQQGKDGQLHERSIHG